jgi:hypothetical protein
VVVDGKEGKQYDFLKMDLLFSPDSVRLAYRARVGKKWCVVVDGEEEKQYDYTWALIFSLDSKHLAYAAEVGYKNFVLLDGKEGKRYDGIPKRGRIIFDSADTLHYLVWKGREIYLVEEKIKSSE